MAVHIVRQRDVKAAPKGMHPAGANLFLQVADDGKARSWIFRYRSRKDGRDKKVGLGSAATVPLDDARQLAVEQHRLLRAGKDPHEEKKARRYDAEIKAGLATTVNDMVDRYFDAHIAPQSANYRKSAARFLIHIRNTIGSLPVGRVTSADILDKVGLREIYATRYAKGVQIHSHVKRVFEQASTECGITKEKNPASWDKLKPVLGTFAKRYKTKHRASLPRTEVGAFLDAVRRYEDRSIRKTGRMTSTYALEFVVLSGVRVDEACQARWDQIDLANRAWNVPPEQRKTGYKSDRIRPVPITQPMQAILEEMQRRRTDPSDDAFVFPSPHGVGKLNPGTVLRFIKNGLKWPTRLTTHGFRTTLQGWARNNGWPMHLVKIQLDHFEEVLVETYGEQDDDWNQRRKMMEAWAAYCDGPYTANVVTLRRGLTA
jgi:integrase